MFLDIVVSLSCLLSDYKPEGGLRSSQNGSLFYPRRVRTKTFFILYLNRVVSIWNNLPKDLRQEQSLDGFVRELISFLLFKVREQF